MVLSWVYRLAALGVCLWGAALAAAEAADATPALAKGTVPFSSEENRDSPPVVSSPVLIVFSSNRSGPWRIWCVRSDGSALRELTKDGADQSDVDPVFSPDGKAILFTSTRGGAAGVWRMPRDGGQPERICDGDQAEWSPDGRQIAFRRNEQLWIRELGSGGERRVIISGESITVALPKGTVPFSSDENRDSPPVISAPVLSADANRPRQWPHCSGPAWSPDGKQIAFACRGDAGNALFVVAATGGEPQTVYDKKGACEPHWAPDGKRLVYETETHICTIDPDGKKNRPVTYFGGVQRYGRFSPDGASIVYCQGASERGPWELYIIPAQGGTPRQLTTGGSDMNPDWK